MCQSKHLCCVHLISRKHPGESLCSKLYLQASTTQPTNPRHSFSKEKGLLLIELKMLNTTGKHHLHEADKCVDVHRMLKPPDWVFIYLLRHHLVD